MSLLTRSKGRTAAGASGSSSDQPWSPMFRAQSSAGTRCEQTANLNVLVRCLPTASPLPPQNRTSARPAGSSAVRLHHFRKHTEGTMAGLGTNATCSHVRGHRQTDAFDHNADIVLPRRPPSSTARRGPTPAFRPRGRGDRKERASFREWQFGGESVAIDSRYGSLGEISPKRRFRAGPG